MFGFGWQDGTAKVVARRLVKEWRDAHTATSPGGKRRKFEYILDVRPPDGSPRFRSTCKNSWKDAVQGDEVDVRFHPKSQRVKIVERRHGSREKRAQPADARWRDMLDDEPGTPPPPR